MASFDSRFSYRCNYISFLIRSEDREIEKMVRMRNQIRESENKGEIYTLSAKARR